MLRLYGLPPAGLDEFRGTELKQLAADLKKRLQREAMEETLMVKLDQFLDRG